MNEFIVKSIDAMDLPETFLMAAHSFGGFLTSLYASQRPHRVESMFLLSPVGFETYDPNDYEPLAYNDQIAPNQLSDPSWLAYTHKIFT